MKNLQPARKKVQKVTEGGVQQALPKAKRTMPAPERLSEIIHLVNLLPVEAIGLREMFDGIQLRHPNIPPLELNKLFLNEFEARVHRLAPEIKRFIGTLQNSEDPSYINQVAARRYNLIIEARQLLVFIAYGNATAIHELRTYYSKPINEKSLEEMWASRNLLDLVFSMHITPVEVIRNEKGEIDWQPTILFEAMQEGKHLRIRQCLICNLYFWAGRIDQMACSKRCTQTLRVRRWRANYLDNYKQQRIQKADEQDQEQKKFKKGKK